jgi:DNA-binding MarR family transcriptional regulator
MTNRIDQLEKAGLVERVHNPQDRRSVLISLTERGFAIVEDAVSAHVENQQRLVAQLSEEERTALNKLVKRFLQGFEA